MHGDMIEDELETILIDGLPEGLKEAIAEAIRKGATPNRILESVDKEDPGPLLREGCRLWAQMCYDVLGRVRCMDN